MIDILNTTVGKVSIPELSQTLFELQEIKIKTLTIKQKDNLIDFLVANKKDAPRFHITCHYFLFLLDTQYSLCDEGRGNHRVEELLADRNFVDVRDICMSICEDEIPEPAWWDAKYDVPYIEETILVTVQRRIAELVDDVINLKDRLAFLKEMGIDTFDDVEHAEQLKVYLVLRELGVADLKVKTSRISEILK
jgi:hypothetical protein